MLDLHTRIAQLKRPNLLARAARFGVDDYRRTVHLRRLLGSDPLPRHGAALMQLLDREAEMNALRLARSGSYSPAIHVEILIAILGEARLLRATAMPASGSGQPR
ncbi:MAG: DUF6477 family protein [Yoonia sp.]|uniref:DUF6477 family protein n=1 Tax=Yoonia sp. TaxID=2212373 RepID=UPI00273FD359|nr:DUF6477 family protein [Yoonia sp.]MDP5086987.1 DUF6477 family protein [Yoonia sp.]MDP5358778.1 DUF6477 family protein [Paracoccaceae bacterium]MDP5360637.1 DUF6477 family protein [Paracoccaceae bacterium]